MAAARQKQANSESRQSSAGETHCSMSAEIRHVAALTFPHPCATPWCSSCVRSGNLA